MEIHPRFRIHHTTYNAVDLRALAQKYVVSGVAFKKDIGEFLLQWLGDSPTIEVKTSGSTGTPKVISLQKSQMINSALATGAYFNLGVGSTALLCLPAKYIAGKMMLVRALVLGWDISFVTPNLTPLKSIQEKFDFIAMIPAQVEQSLKELHRAQLVLIGGAALSTTLRKKLLKLRTQSFESYGMTETITHIALKKIDQDYFSCLPEVNVTKDDRGCLVINAPKVADYPVITNDLADLESENRFKWLGRWDNIINSGGVKLIPELIEKKYAEIFTNRFFVTGLPDAQFGNQLVLVVEGNPSAEQDIIGKLDSLQNLEKLEYPKKILYVPQFVLTETGKVNRSKTLALVLG